MPSALRVAGLRSIVTLFAEVFAPRLRTAVPEYARTGKRAGPKPPTHKLEYVCFMFWDVAPIVPGREGCADTDREVIKVLEATLALDSAACQHGALHGLGHWHHAAPDEVSRIVGHWLQSHPQAPDKLRSYAVQASVGSVL